jgi:tetratricopeptide (TPR) repeat protein
MVELADDSGRAADAESLARTALQEFRTQREPVQEISAQGLLARSLLHQGKISEAREDVAQAWKLSKKTPDMIRRLTLTLDQAALLAATKDIPAAENAAQHVLAQTERLGLFRLHLEASLTLGEVQLQEKSPDLGRKRLEETEKIARSKGFEIARKASAARQATHR